MSTRARRLISDASNLAFRGFLAVSIVAQSFTFETGELSLVPDVISAAVRLPPGSTMSKSRIAIAAILLVTAFSSAASARGRVHLGIGSLGGTKFAFTRLFAPGLFHQARAHHGRRHVRHIQHASVRSQSTGDGMNPQSRGNGSANDSLLSDPAERLKIATAVALAPWHGERQNGAGGWWRHTDGGYGWVGPVYWPFAHYDIFDYMISGGTGLWEYGYPDIYAGIFAPYGHADLAAYSEPGPSARKHHTVPPLQQQLCGENNRETSGLPIDQLQQVIQPNEAQHTALDELASASASAAQMIRASCSGHSAFTAPDRLASMQQRIETMMRAVITLEPPLQNLYDLLDNDQKTRLNALANGRRKATAADGATETPEACEAAQARPLQWPDDEIQVRLHPNDTQRGALDALQRAMTRAARILNDECRPEAAITPPERLFAADQRLEAIQQAVNLVSAALEGFYVTLDDKQKTEFEAIGPKRTAN
jgi:hypothetical protein